MNLQEIALDDAFTFHNGKAPKVNSEGQFSIFGSNGRIGFSKEFNHDSALIIGRVGAYCGSVEYSLDPFWASDNTIIVKPRENQNLRYWYYRLKSFPLGNYAGGAAQPLLTQGTLKPIKLWVHKNEDEQCQIANVLTTYDDLIENNRRRIQLLEESARLLYQEWFVHLRFPGHEQVKITDGVPEGWSHSSIGKLSSYLNRGITPRYDEDGEFVVINQKCIRNRVLSFEQARKQSKEFSDEKEVRIGDILVNSTGTGTLGRVAQVWESVEKTCVDTHVTIVRPADEIPYLWLGYTLLSMEKRFEDMGEGATNQKELKRQYVSAVTLVRPPHSLMELFHDTFLENTKQIQNLIKTNKALAEARDLLLPKLMSGELTV